MQMPPRSKEIRTVQHDQLVLLKAVGIATTRAVEDKNSTFLEPIGKRRIKALQQRDRPGDVLVQDPPRRALSFGRYHVIKFIKTNDSRSPDTIKHIDNCIRRLK